MTASRQSLFRDADGHNVLIQWPNPALWTFFLAVLLRWSSWDARDTELLWIGRGALIAWAADEILRGDALLRRLLGAAALAWQVFVFVT